MSLGTWDPDAAGAAKTATIDPAKLQQFIGWSRENQLDELAGLLGTEAQILAGLMALEPADWAAAAEGLEDEDILHLVRFFAVAENLPGWEAAERSPVIPLARILRNRGSKPDRDFLIWLRSVNNNRFLPYGPL